MEKITSFFETNVVLLVPATIFSMILVWFGYLLASRRYKGRIRSAGVVFKNGGYCLFEASWICGNQKIHQFRSVRSFIPRLKTGKSLFVSDDYLFIGHFGHRANEFQKDFIYQVTLDYTGAYTKATLKVNHFLDSIKNAGAQEKVSS